MFKCEGIKFSMCFRLHKRRTQSDCLSCQPNAISSKSSYQHHTQIWWSITKQRWRLWFKHRYIYCTSERSVLLQLLFYIKPWWNCIYISAVVDNVARVHTCINSQKSNHINTSGHLLYELKKGNKVWLRTWHVRATYIHGNRFSFFSGNRIA